MATVGGLAKVSVPLWHLSAAPRPGHPSELSTTKCPPPRCYSLLAAATAFCLPLLAGP